jgi:ribonuclease III
MAALPDFAVFAEDIGYPFTNLDYLREAFTHRSYLNEHRGVSWPHNERLEFLGDAVLELVITEYLYKKYPKENEGRMTAYRSALVNTNSISDAANDLRMGDYLLLSKGEARDTGRARLAILANTFEAVIGAIFLDQGFEAAKRFITTALVPKLDDIIAQRTWQDAKSNFQEQAQEHVGITPHYNTIRELGPDHEKVFEIGVYIGDDLIATGQGKSKQDAEQAAARAALERKGW